MKLTEKIKTLSRRRSPTKEELAARAEAERTRDRAFAEIYSHRNAGH